MRVDKESFTTPVVLIYLVTDPSDNEQAKHNGKEYGHDGTIEPRLAPTVVDPYANVYGYRVVVDDNQTGCSRESIAHYPFAAFCSLVAERTPYCAALRYIVTLSWATTKVVVPHNRSGVVVRKCKSDVCPQRGVVHRRRFVRFYRRVVISHVSLRKAAPIPKRVIGNGHNGRRAYPFQLVARGNWCADICRKGASDFRVYVQVFLGNSRPDI